MSQCYSEIGTFLFVHTVFSSFANAVLINPGFFDTRWAYVNLNNFGGNRTMASQRASTRKDQQRLWYSLSEL